MHVFTLPAEDWNELSIDKQVIRHLILKHRSFVDHLITLEDYYEGKHKILNDKNRENKLVCNHAKDISDTASSYFIGNPVTYKAQTDITDLTDKLEYAGADEADGDNGLDLSIFGRAYEYIYTKKDETDLMIKNLSPANTFVVYDDTIEQNELFAVYYYAKRDDSDRTDIKYIATVVTEHYKYILNIQNIDGIQPTYEQAEPHYKGEVPIIEYLNNKMGLGDFELQIPLIDAYNALMSDRVTDKEQFIDAILGEYTRQTKEAAHMADTRATESESWAHGHKLYPERDKDNAKYYADQAKQVATQNGFCRMEIREDGHLYLSRTENIVQSLDFKINDKGRLGVMMS